MDVVYFIEKVLGKKLLDYQKSFVRKLYKAETNGKSVVCVPPRGSDRHELRLLYALTIIFTALEKGSIKNDAGCNIWIKDQLVK